MNIDARNIPEGPYLDMLRYIVQSPHDLNHWQRTFATNLLEKYHLRTKKKYRFVLTEKQRACIEDIYTEIRQFEIYRLKKT